MTRRALTRGALTVLAASGLIGLSLQSAGAAEKWSDVVAAAKKEGKVVFYHNITPKGIEPILKKFREANPGIQTEHVRLGSSPLIQRFSAEFGAGRHLADVVITFTDDRIAKGMKAGWMLKWTPPELAQFPADVNRENLLFTLQYAREGIIYNKRLVKPADVPKEWTDLFDPKWKGKVGQNPTWRSVSVQQLIAYLRKKGIKDPAEALKANEVRLFNGSGGIIQAIIRGDIHVAHISDLPVNTAIADGAPVAIVYPKSGTTLSANQIFVAAKAPHPNAARVFVNWLMTKDGQTALQHFGGLSVTRKGMPPLSHLPATSALSNTVDGRTILTPALQKEIIEHWRKVFGVK